ncbi:hypothetical protein LCGC14_1919970 [marine sediment metagenome]|uniref:Uncharacterized protein n=1 Tax=marine sediment metagenome TaxID=412755 RepID=A0A0F9I526_9ZZZZ
MVNVFQAQKKAEDLFGGDDLENIKKAIGRADGAAKNCRFNAMMDRFSEIEGVIDSRNKRLVRESEDVEEISPKIRESLIFRSEVIDMLGRRLEDECECRLK